MTADIASPDALAALAALAFASVWTPGPNNAMLAASGATFGWRATWPHAFGVAIGFPAMLFAVALGLGEAFKASELMREGLRWGGAALLLWLGWKIATAGRAADGTRRGRPFTFWEAAAFQWVNVKAWIMALSTAAAFVGGASPLREAAVCAGVFLLAGLTSSHGWAGFGAALRDWLAEGARLRLFNGTMGALIALSALYLAAAEI
jgi:threonine/homoserine/homoserine lactone efflux protein